VSALQVSAGAAEGLKMKWGTPKGPRARPAGAALAAMAVCLTLCASPALAVTAPPELLSPEAAHTYGSPLAVEYVLPEAAGPGAMLAFVPEAGGSPSLLMLTEAERTAGTHSFPLDLHELSLADGKYKVSLSYQNLAKEPAASASVEKVTIKTVTGSPLLTAPLAGQAFFEPFAATYSLPEAALANSVRLVFTSVDGGGTKELTLTNTEAGEHTVEVAPSNPLSKPGIAAGPLELPADEYELSLRYQDALGNAAASTTPMAMRITNGPPCTPGTYSVTGEAPCAEAPKGFHVPESGATLAAECVAGSYTPEKGMAFCLPADPGHYVPAKGASAELECEAGSFAPVTGSSGCTPTPENTYAARGAFEPTPCPAGTRSGVGAASCSPVGGASSEIGDSAGTGSGGSGSKPAEAGAGKTPSGTPVGVAAGRVTVRIAAGKHRASLARARRQRYVLRCSATATVLVRVNALVRAGRRRVAVTGRKRTVACRAGKPVEGVVSFALTRAAKRLLSQHGARVRLTVLVYGTGAAGRGRLAGATVRGTR